MLQDNKISPHESNLFITQAKTHHLWRKMISLNCVNVELRNKRSIYNHFEIHCIIIPNNAAKTHMYNMCLCI